MMSLKVLDKLGIVHRSLSTQTFKHLERKHVSPEAYKEENRKYKSHPFSRKESKPLLLKSDNVSWLFKSLSKAHINTPPHESALKRSTEKTMEDKNIVYLTEKEFELSETKFKDRHRQFLTPDHELLQKRDPIENEEIKDEGLSWLFNSDVTFVDSSKCTNDNTRYIVTRTIDGTLYHNDHVSRDNINNSFFRENDRLFPTPLVFEDDQLFENAISGEEVDYLGLLEQLHHSYPTDHEMFVKRHSQLAEAILHDETATLHLISSRFFIGVVQRVFSEKRNGDFANLLACCQEHGYVRIQKILVQIMRKILR